MQFVHSHRLGTVYGSDAGFRLKRSPDTALCPDTSCVRAERLPEDDRSGIMDLAPDLAVVVVSPSNTINEMDDKVAAYLEAGTSIVWVVRPRRRQVTIYTADGPVRVLCDADVLDGGTFCRGLPCRSWTCSAIRNSRVSAPHAGFARGSRR